MKQFLTMYLLPILVGLMCFAAIYAGSGIFTTRDSNKVEYRLTRKHRFLPDRNRDPVMMNIGTLRHVTDTFNSTVYLRKSQPGKREAFRLLVEDYMSEYPLHLLVETDAKIQREGGSVDRTLKRFYYYNGNGD